jgi:hypothetical protein
MVARQTLVRNGSRTQTEGRAYVGVYKGAAKDSIKAGAPIRTPARLYCS